MIDFVTHDPSPTLTPRLLLFVVSPPLASRVSAAEVLAEAQKYAKTKVSNALQKGKSILADAAAAGRLEAKKSVSTAKSPAEKLAHAAEKAEKQALKKAKKLEAKAAQEAKAQKAKLSKLKAAEKAKKAKQAALKAKAARKASPFRGRHLKADKDGVFGGVSFGLPKIDSTPVPLKDAPKRTALERFSKHGPKKNIYGHHKSCLKDIAAHFDEKDIYESKKLSLLQKMSTAKSVAHAQRLRSKLQNLETWHQMMQKKFLMSANEQKDHQRRVEKLFDEHLPQELKDQLQANKVAKRAAQKIPFPEAQAQAFKILRSKRKEIQRADRLTQHGHKRMIRPEINDKGFPSMDPISSSLREKLWRTVETQDEWSTEKTDIERAENIVTAAHKAHGDFVDGPIAEPMLRGKLYHPDTERLGVPNFLTKFPCQFKDQNKERHRIKSCINVGDSLTCVSTMMLFSLTLFSGPMVDEKVTMNDKVRVEQTYHQTW